MRVAYSCVESDVIQRLLRCKFDEKTADNVVLFVRLEGENYACLGRLAWESCDVDTFPVTFTWRLLDFDDIHGTSYFQTLLKTNLA
jgi:hypothetical protein